MDYIDSMNNDKQMIWEYLVDYTAIFFNFIWEYAEFCVDNQMI